MATFSRVLLSGSTNGKSVLIDQTAIATGTTIHTAVAGTASYDEIYVWITNTSGSAVTLTIGFGGVTDPDNLICKALSIPANSPPIPVLTGQVLQNSLIVKMAAGTGSVLLATGFCNRIA